LLEGLLNPDPAQRWDACTAAKDPWISRSTDLKTASSDRSTACPRVLEEDGGLPDRGDLESEGTRTLLASDAQQDMMMLVHTSDDTPMFRSPAYARQLSHIDEDLFKVRRKDALDF
jgi:hypothetical protein